MQWQFYWPSPSEKGWFRNWKFYYYSKDEVTDFPDYPTFYIKTMCIGPLQMRWYSN